MAEEAGEARLRLRPATFGHRHRQTDVSDRYFSRVDVTEEFTFLVSKIAPTTTTEP